MPDLKQELRRLANDAARQARPMALDDVIREAERRGTAVQGRQRNDRAPRRRRPGWLVPLAAGVAVVAAVGVSVAISRAVPASAPVGAGSAARTVYAIYSAAGTPGNSGPSTVVPVRNGKAGKLIRVDDAGDAVVTPDGKTLYVPGAGTIIPISTATGKPGKPINVRAVGPGAVLTVDPNGKMGYASSNGSSTVVPIDLATNKPGKPIHLPGSWVGQIVFAPDGKTAYDLPDSGPDGVTPISTATGRTGRQFLIGDSPSGMLFSPDGKTAYVTALNAGAVVVTPVNLATGNTGRPIYRTKNSYPDSMVLTPDGKTLYIAAKYGVVPVSTATGKAGPAIGSRPAEEMVITPNGKTVYVNNLGGSDGAIVPISTATKTAGKPILKGDYSKIGLSPGGGTLYAATLSPGSAQLGQIKIVPINSATGTLGRAIRIPVTVGTPYSVLTP